MDEIFEVEFEDVTIVEPVIEPLSITENGRYEAEGIIDGYSPIDVDVQPTIEELNITDNGVYNAPEGVHGFNPVTVDVQPPLEELNATFNGEFLPSEDNYGFSKVTVDVPIPGQIEFKDVNFIDYDGTLLYSYTANEFLTLTEMPPNPEHDRLIAQGWNWTLQEAKETVTEFGECLIGQEYDTASGATEIDIELAEGRLSPYLGIGLNGTATVDWGDGSAVETITGNNLNSLLKNVTHTYSSAGKYIIKISGGSIRFLGNNTNSYLLTTIENNSPKSYQYTNCVISIYMSTNAAISDYGCCNLYNLTEIVLPRISAPLAYGTTSSFKNQNSLRAVVFPHQYEVVGSANVFDSNRSVEQLSFGRIFGFHNSNDSGFVGGAVNRINPFQSSFIPTGSFQNNRGLKTVKIATNTIYGSAFSSTSIICLILYSTVELLKNYSLANMQFIGELKFKSVEPPVAEGSYTFQNLPTDCKIYVPRGSLEAYTTATNYPSSTTYQYIEY